MIEAKQPQKSCAKLHLYSGPYCPRCNAERQAAYRAKLKAAADREKNSVAALQRIGRLVDGRSGEVAQEIAGIVKSVLAGEPIEK